MLRNKIKNYYNQEYYNYLSFDGDQQKVSMSKWAYEYDLSLLSFLRLSLGQRLLDVGCGAGYLLKVAEDIGLITYGLDCSITALRYSKRLASKSSTVVGYAEKLPYKNGSFNIVSFIGTLEHFPNPDLAIKEEKRVARPNGNFLILVPNSKYILHLIGYKTSTQPFDWQRDLNGWKKLLADSGLKIDKIVGDNKHLISPKSSTLVKAFAKKIINPFVKYLPLTRSYHFLFLCSTGH